MKRFLFLLILSAAALGLIYQFIWKSSGSVISKELDDPTGGLKKIATSPENESESHDVPSNALPEGTHSSDEATSPIQMMVKIKEAASQGKFPYEFLRSILTGHFPKDVKFMALQAFHQANWTNASEIYVNTQPLIDFIDRALPEMDVRQREVISRILERLNDPQNPNKDIANSYIDEKFHEYKDSDKDRAALFLNAHMDPDKVYEVMKDKNDPQLSEVARNRIPHIAQPKLIKEIVTQSEYSIDQKLAAFQRLAGNVDGEKRANNMSDADALIIWAKDLDKKNGSGNKFYRAALSGISSSPHKDKENYLFHAMKQGLEPYRAKQGSIAYSKVPELAAMFEYLISLPPDSQTYTYFVAELETMTKASACPNTQADAALTNLISFWQYTCELGDDCNAAAKNHQLYQTISAKYMDLKKKCPGIG